MVKDNLGFQFVAARQTLTSVAGLELLTTLIRRLDLIRAIRSEVRVKKIDYGFREGAVARKDTLDLATGGLGYNLRNRTRVSLNYEYSRRRSPALAERNYDRRRIFTSWTYAF